MVETVYVRWRNSFSRLWALASSPDRGDNRTPAGDGRQRGWRKVEPPSVEVTPPRPAQQGEPQPDYPTILGVLESLQALLAEENL